MLVHYGPGNGKVRILPVVEEGIVVFKPPGKFRVLLGDETVNF